MRNTLYTLFVFLAVFALSTIAGADEAKKTITLEELKEQITAKTANFKDLTQTAVITYKNKSAMAKVKDNLTNLYDFKTAKISIKYPDMMRTEGKLGMVGFTYIINGTTRYIRVPSLRTNKKNDYEKEPSKVQDLLQFGLVTPEIWTMREPKILPDPEAEANGEILLSAGHPNNDMQKLFWIDNTNFYMKKYEKRNPDGTVIVTIVYSKPELFDGVIWVPTVAELYAPNGDKAGELELQDTKVNTGLSDDLFN